MHCKGKKRKNDLQTISLFRAFFKVSFGYYLGTKEMETVEKNKTR
jgi:hypothetical protein